MVKINALDEKTPNPRPILEQLLGWLTTLRGRTKPFVIQKILSTLSVYFSKFSETWPNAVATVMACLMNGSKPFGPEQDCSEDEIVQFLSSAKSEDIELILKYSQTLIEDLSNDNQTNIAAAKTGHILKERNLLLYCRILQFTFDNYTKASDSLLIQAVSSYVVWVQYFCSSKSSLDSDGLLRKQAPYLLHLLQHSEDEVVQKAIDGIIDITNYVASFWTRSFQQHLAEILIMFGNSMEQTYFSLREEDDHFEKVELFIKLLLCYCSEYMDPYLASEGADQSYQQLLSYLLIFTKGRQEDRTINETTDVEILMFWSSFAEEIIGGGYLTAAHTGTVSEYMAQITAIYWERIKFPSEEVTKTWKNDTWDALTTFRRDLCDLLETVYPLVGEQLFELLVNSILQALSAHNDPSLYDWETIECSLYCLNGLSAIIAPEGAEYAKVRNVFASSLWKDLPACHNLRVRQTAVNLIGSFDSFFERPEGHPYISVAMEYLFNSLYIPNLSLTASRSIQKLCVSCGKFITELLPSFFDTYESMSLYSQLENTAHERTVSALAYVIQEIPTRRQVVYVDRLTSIIIQQAQVAFEAGTDALSTGSVLDPALTRTVSLLKCLVGIGKGLRKSDDVQDSMSAEMVEEAYQVWQKDATKQRQKILELVKVFSIDKEPFNEDSQICEVCCDIFKCGLSEKYPNAFVFDAGTVLTFIVAKHQMGPHSCFSSLADLSCCLITSEQHGKISQEQINEHASILLDTFFEQSTVALDLEPDVQTANLKLLSHMIIHGFFAVFLRHKNIELMIKFLMSMLGSADRLVLRDASAFWSSFISRSPTGDAQAVALKDTIFISIGPSLTQLIAEKISGDASRSDLDLYINVIRRMIVKYGVESKQWFTNCIVEQPTAKLASKDQRFRSLFVQQLFMLRGSKETVQVVKNFWLTCRGLPNY